MGNSADPIWQPLRKINQDLLRCWVFSHPEFIHELVVDFFFLGKQPRDPDIQGGQNTHRFPVEGIHLHQSEIFPEKKHTLFPEKICLVVSNMAFIFHWPYMGYTILPIDELHHFSRWAHCTTNQVIINHH